MFIGFIKLLEALGRELPTEDCSWAFAEIFPVNGELSVGEFGKGSAFG